MSLLRRRHAPLLLAANTKLLGSGAASYTANAVTFDGTNDYLSATSLTGSNTKTGIISLWFQRTGGAGTSEKIFLRGFSEPTQLDFVSGNNLRLVLEDSSGTRLYNASSTTTFSADSTWHHALICIDLANTTVKWYIDDAAETVTETTAPVDGTIAWVSGTGTNANEWLIGDTQGGGQKLTADVADLYINPATYIDPATEANRRKFIDANDKPVDLGSDGSTPTGAQPLIFLSGDTDDWHTNKGSGGGFTENGALTTASTSPSD